MTHNSWISSDRHNVLNDCKRFQALKEKAIFSEKS